MKEIKKNQIEKLDTKITIYEVKNVLERINGRLDISEEKISEGKVIGIGTIQNGQKRGKVILKKKNNKQSISERWNNFRQPKVINLPEGEGRKVEVERNI